MVLPKNIELKGGKEEKSTTIGEMVKLTGICVLIYKIPVFIRGRDLWGQTAPSKYVPEFKLGRLTGTARNGFDMIWSCLILIHQPK